MLLRSASSLRKARGGRVNSFEVSEGLWFLPLESKKIQKGKKYGFMGVGWVKLQEKLSRIPGLIWQHFPISKERETSM